MVDLNYIFCYNTVMKHKNKYYSKYEFENKFDIISELGSGGNGKVFQVRKKSDGKEYALKMLKIFHNNSDNEKKSRFNNELKIMLENYKTIEGIIPIIDYSYNEFWYTMPIAKPILEYINSSSSKIDEIIKHLIKLSDTLLKLHYKGISHRDIKPSNIYFYNNRYYFGDFGLVDFSENNNHFTKSNKGLGAIFTIAPEMKRNPKNADSKKADIFSLAKTTWMLITGNELGFDGSYDFRNKNHSLRFMGKFKDTHLVELDELLKQATDDNPENRPDINEFKKQLEIWLNTSSNEDKIQFSNWHFLDKYIFGELAPESSVWRNIDKIINILNIISESRAYNHMLFSNKGGFDFIRAEKANEKNCIYIYDSSNGCSVVKPKCLYYEGFENNYIWNYFLIELDNLDKIIDDQLDYEYLVEDYPAHYVSGQYEQYGVYDYDKGNKLPEGYKTVYRYLRGKFLIVLKNGVYNSATSTYDGRHGKFTNEQFREYISTIIDLSEKTEKQFKEKSDKDFSKELIAENLLNKYKLEKLI